MENKEKDKVKILRDMIVSQSITELSIDLIEGLKIFDYITDSLYKKQVDILAASLSIIAQKSIMDLKQKHGSLTEDEQTLSIQVNLSMQRLEKFYEENYKDICKETEIYVKKNT